MKNENISNEVNKVRKSKNVSVCFWVRRDIYDEIKRRAAAEDRTVSSFVRRWLKGLVNERLESVKNVQQ